MQNARERLIDAQLAMAKNVAKNGGKILVIGARPDNVPQDIWNHPRIVFYESTDSNKGDDRAIPDNVRLVIFTRFLSHRTHSHFTRAANRRNIHCVPALQTTGGLRRILEEANIMEPDKQPEVDPIDYQTVTPHTPLVLPPLPPPGTIAGLYGGFYTTVEHPKGQKAPKGTLHQFFREYVAHHYPKGLPSTTLNYARILQEAEHIGLRTTQASIQQHSSVYRAKQRDAARPTAPPLPLPPAVADPPRDQLTLDAVAMIDEIVISLGLLKEKLATDYGRLDALVAARVRDRLQALLSA